MPTVTSYAMAIAMWNAGGTGIIHRFNTVKEQVELYKLASVRLDGELVNETDAGCAVGVNEGYERIEALYEAGCRIFCVDVAHGDSVYTGGYMGGLDPDLKLHSNFILGSIVSPEGAERAITWGADAIRVGIGNGSACTTRGHTGFGIPQITALQRVREAVQPYKNKNGLPIRVISCGGHRSAGDVVKSLAAGADSVILGGMLAGASESPTPGKYVGAAHGERYDEGIAGTVPRTGPVQGTLDKIMEGVRSGISYGGAKSIPELQQNAEFMQVAPGTAREGFSA